jgi:cell division protein ZapB
MDSVLKALEQKVSQLVGLCQQLRTENIALRQELAQSQSDAARIKENMAFAADKLEALIESLPGDTDE